MGSAKADSLVIAAPAPAIAVAFRNSRLDAPMRFSPRMIPCGYEQSSRPYSSKLVMRYRPILEFKEGTSSDKMLYLEESHDSDIMSETILAQTG
jgi:hypothetical protein